MNRWRCSVTKHQNLLEMVAVYAARLFIVTVLLHLRYETQNH